MTMRPRFINRLAQPISSKFIVILACISAALVAGILIAYESFSILALLFSPLIVFLLILKPKIGVVLFYFSIFIPSGYIERYFTSVTTILLWLPHMILLITLISLFVSKPRTISIKTLWPTSLFWVVLAWVGLALISTIVNASSPLSAVLSLRGLFIIFGSVVLHRLYFSPNQQKQLIIGLVVMGLLMLPVSIFQRVYLVSYLRLGSGDMVTGLFTSYTELVFFQLFCILAVISWWLHGRRLLPIHPAIVIALLFLSLAISNSKAAVIYFFLVVAFLFLRFQKRFSLRAFNAMLILVIVGIMGTLAFENIYQSSYGEPVNVYSFKGAWNYFFSEHQGNSHGGLQRGAAIVFNYNLITKEPLSLLFGLGPGSLSDSRVPGGTGYIFSRYPFMDLNYSSLSTILGELGFAGICLLGCLMLSIYYSHSKLKSPNLVALVKSTVFLMVIMLVYGTIMLFPVVALIIGVLCIPNNNYLLEPGNRYV